jgi:hypothetical protein
MANQKLVTTPQSSDDLIKYAKTQLGEPVLVINVSNEQCQTRLREALDLFNTWHMDANLHFYLAQQLQAADVSSNSITVPDFVNEVVRALSFNGMPEETNGTTPSIPFR